MHSRHVHSASGEIEYDPLTVLCEEPSSKDWANWRRSFTWRTDRRGRPRSTYASCVGFPTPATGSGRAHTRTAPGNMRVNHRKGGAWRPTQSSREVTGY